MSSFFFRFLSVVLHPLLMPFYGMVIIFNFPTYLSYTIAPVLQRIVLILVFISTCVMPALTALLLLQKGKVNSLLMETNTERNIPFLVTAVCYLVCFYFLKQLPLPRFFSLVVLGGGTAIALAYLINLKWKISIHMIGIGGLAAIIYFFAETFNTNILYSFCAVIIIAGLLGTARLTENSHTPRQIYAGFICGFLTEWMVLAMGNS